MLSSTYYHNVDAKRRIFVPSRYRDELGETFVVALSRRSRCLEIYSMSEWETVLAGVNAMDRKDSEPIFRYFIGTSLEVTVDTQGRIILTPELLQFAQIKKEAVIIGCGKYAEIWSAENYREYMSNVDFSAMLQSLEKIGL